MVLQEKVINSVLGIIVYVPLILLAFSMIFAFFYYRTYRRVFVFLSFIGRHFLAGLIWLGDLITTNPLLSLLSFLSVMALGWFSIISVYHPDFLFGGVAGSVATIVIGVFVILAVLLLYVILNRRNGATPFPTGQPMGIKARWIKTNVIKELWFSIVIGLGIAMVFFLLWGLTNLQNTYSGTMFNIFSVLVGLGLLFGIYSLVSKNPTVKHWLQNNILFNGLYHLIFVIPCSFLWLANHLYKEFKNTPHFAYILLGLEIIFLMGFFLIPIITKKIYNFSYKKFGKKGILEQEIATLTQSRYYYTELNNNLKSAISVDWHKIITTNLNNDPDGLKNYLQVLGYDNEKKKSMLGGETWTLDEVIKYINKQLPSIMDNENYITDTEYKLKKKEKELSNVSTALRSTTLLNRPIPTNVKKTIGTYENIVDKNATEYNYNYAISFWVFLHNYGTNMSPSYVVDTPLLSYGNRPSVTWNGKSNLLKVKMRDANNNIQTIYETGKIPLQKWINIVVNYNGGTLDVFIDNKLVASKGNIVPYMAYDTIVVGADKGISGGICNVNYYNNILTKNQINIYYNLLKGKNPPIV
jgi:hypothetical protein